MWSHYIYSSWNRWKIPGNLGTLFVVKDKQKIQGPWKKISNKKKWPPVSSLLCLVYHLGPVGSYSAPRSRETVTGQSKCGRNLAHFFIYCFELWFSLGVLVYVTLHSELPTSTIYSVRGAVLARQNSFLWRHRIIVSVHGELEDRTRSETHCWVW